MQQPAGERIYPINNSQYVVNGQAGACAALAARWIASAINHGQALYNSASLGAHGEIVHLQAAYENHPSNDEDVAILNPCGIRTSRNETFHLDHARLTTFFNNVRLFGGAYYIIMSSAPTGMVDDELVAHNFAVYSYRWHVNQQDYFIFDPNEGLYRQTSDQFLSNAQYIIDAYHADYDDFEWRHCVLR